MTSVFLNTPHLLSKAVAWLWEFCRQCLLERQPNYRKTPQEHRQECLCYQLQNGTREQATDFLEQAVGKAAFRNVAVRTVAATFFLER